MYPSSSRRSLHQPLFPLYSSSSSPPSQPPSFPKYPFSASSNPPPFFPLYPPPLPTFPANISSLLTPSHNAPHPSKLLLLITLPTLSLLLLLLSLLLHRRRRRTTDKTHTPPPGSDSHSLTATSPTPDSPELFPLPPLPRHSRRSYSDEDVFYSPLGAPERPHSPSSSVGSPSSSFSPPPPPPPPTSASSVKNPIFLAENADDVERRRRRRRLKPLHWDKVRASSERNMVWDYLSSCSSFQLDEEKIETLFGCDSVMGVTRNGQVDVVIDTNKSQNIAILLRALSVTAGELREALLEGKTDRLGNELLETLLKMAPTKEEERKLKEYEDDSLYKLGPPEKFLKAMVDIPFAFKRVDAMLYIANFDSDIGCLKLSFTTLELACEELRSSRLFRKLLDAVLKTGNRMNVGTNHGDAQAFKLDTLLKLVDIKGTDGKTTLFHFVVQEISRAEGLHQQTNTRKEDDLQYIKLGLKVVSKLGTELSNVKKAATFDSEILISYVSKLTGGIGKVREVVRLIDGCFRESMIVFLRRAEGEIAELQTQEGVVFSLVKDATEYFHGDSAKEEAHPFRIFAVVRDFLTVLDQVCREVGRVNEDCGELK